MAKEHCVSREEIDALADQIAEVSAHMDAAMHTMLTHIRRFDEIEGWGRQGSTSCAHWLNWRIGMSVATARDHVRVAHALAKLPQVDEALRCGQISYSKVRAMCRVATPATEEGLVAMAKSSTAAHMEKICRLFRGIQPVSAETARGRDDDRWIRTRTTDEGMVRFEAQLTAEEAALIGKAVQAMGGKADGLVAMADAVLRGSAADRTPTEVVIHIDANTLQGSTEDGAGVSAETARRLCCDAGLVPVLEDATGKTLDVGRRTRSMPAAIKRALQIRDGGCLFPGCDHRRGEGHHVRHWANGGETSLDNACLLCKRHHIYVHEYGFSIRRDGDAFVFLDPDGEVIPATGAKPPRVYDVLKTMRETFRARGITIDAKTSLPRWLGETPDYDAAVGWLGRAEDRARRREAAAAATSGPTA